MFGDAGEPRVPERSAPGPLTSTAETRRAGRPRRPSTSRADIPVSTAAHPASPVVFAGARGLRSWMRPASIAASLRCFPPRVELAHLAGPKSGEPLHGEGCGGQDVFAVDVYDGAFVPASD